MKAIFRYRRERIFARPPETIWPLVADTARLNELSGFVGYQVEEKPDAAGRVRRLATARIGPLPVKWEESFGEWQENRRVSQRRDFLFGPIRRFEVCCDLIPEGSGTRMRFAADIECVGIIGLLAKASRLLEREGDKRLAAIERMAGELEAGGGSVGWSKRDLIRPSGRRRFAALGRDLARDPASHGLAPKLLEAFAHAPATVLRSLRPLALARDWNADPRAAVELCLAAQRRGMLAMGWDLLCPRCRGAKARVASLHELPTGAHCSACNIDYGRDFSRNVELTFRPQPWLRALPQGEFCLLGQHTTPHVKFQALVAAHSQATFELSLPPGPYRFRTVEAGPSADADIGPDAVIPELDALDSGMILRFPGCKDEIMIRNNTDHTRLFVVEDRNWARDALTGPRVIAMPEFRRLCPEQLLRPGDDVEIASIAIMFTDLSGSTQLYDRLGDARAYHLVRDHFAFLSERVERHAGVIVKTVGDAVMAAFHDPADAVRAALSIQDEVAGFNRGRDDDQVVLKLGVHAGSCIAVTTAGTLDYFGSTVNTASRLEHQCRGGEVVVSGAVLAEATARELIAGRTCVEDSAFLRGLSEPVRFWRVGLARA